MNKKVLTKLKHKRKLYQRWKQEQVTQEEYKNSLSLQGWERQIHLELNLVRYVKSNKKASTDLSVAKRRYD